MLVILHLLGNETAPATHGGVGFLISNIIIFQNFSLKKRIDRRNVLHKKIADSAPVIILSSQMAQSDFHDLYPKAASRTQVLNFISYLEPHYFELNPQLTQEQYGLPDSFFLISNQFWKHKNHALVIEALGLLKQRKIFPTVVCTGSAENNRSEYLLQLMSRIEELNSG